MKRRRKWIHSVLKQFVDCGFRTFSGRVDWQRRGSVSHQRGQEPGVRPADGLVPAATSRLHSAQHLQPHGDLLRLMPPQGQPLHAIPRVLSLRWAGRLCGEEREENHQGFLAAIAFTCCVGFIGYFWYHITFSAPWLVMHKARCNITTL